MWVTFALFPVFSQFIGGSVPSWCTQSRTTTNAVGVLASSPQLARSAYWGINSIRTHFLIP